MNNSMNTLGKWITNNTNRPFMAKKKLNLERPVKNAKALVTGLGQFNFLIDEKKVSDHVLDPGWTNYNKRVLYVDFDVTDYLQKGEHTLLIDTIVYQLLTDELNAKPLNADEILHWKANINTEIDFDSRKQLIFVEYSD